MTRTLAGRIKVWNHSAEELYGWKKEEAVGRISHELLKTQFPKPLLEIESELVRKGQWQGSLVHTTRDGDRVVVESQWTLDPIDSGALVEINIPSKDKNGLKREPGADGDSVQRGRQRQTFGVNRFGGPRGKLLNSELRRTVSDIKKTLGMFAILLCVCTFIAWGLYAWLGHYVLEIIYENNSPWLVDKIMKSRAITPLQGYYDAADQWMLALTFRVVVVLLIVTAFVVLLSDPIGVLLACCSLIFCSLMLFSLLELYPSLIGPLGLDRIEYYAWKGCCTAHDTLVFRNRPFFKSTSFFMGNMYSPKYGIEVQPETVELTTDKNGFVYNSSTGEVSTIAIIGDSFVATGVNEADTFGRRLEKLSGLTVANLGVPGYGPFQYLEVLKGFGIRQKPKYAFFVFYAGNDIDDTREFLQWKRGGKYYYASVLAQSVPSRYFEALKSTARLLKRASDALGAKALLRLREHKLSAAIHPDIAVIDVGRNTYQRMLIPAENTVRSSGELMDSEEGRALKNILDEFKNLSVKNDILPMILYIPTVTTIYAERSTEASGANWLERRSEQIARKTNTEDALLKMAQSVDIDVISLTPVFESAAAQGELLYYPFDTHWTSEGREVAAAYVADVLRSTGESRPSKSKPGRKTSAP